MSRSIDRKVVLSRMSLLPYNRTRVEIRCRQLLVTRVFSRFVIEGDFGVFCGFLLACIITSF